MTVMKWRVASILAAACVLTGVACGNPAPVQTPPQETVAPVVIPAPVTPAAETPPVETPAPTPARVFGHFPYAEAPRDTLRAGSCSGAGERANFRADAWDALSRMKRDAQAAGVTLNPSSCFRTVASQTGLYTCATAPNGTGCSNGRRVSEKMRATAVAPPGHSEHHTGYAIDFFPSATDLNAGGGCASRAACETNPAFARSRSGRWLAAHAADYGFELSFWDGSTQGVMIEAWHYRFVGSPEAEAIFHAARTQFPSPKPGVLQK